MMELKTFTARLLSGPVIPHPTASLYLRGTTILAVGLVDEHGDGLTNPFVGTDEGRITLAAPDGDYDLRMVGGGRDTTMPVRFRADPIGKGVPISTEAGISRTALAIHAGQYTRFTHADAKTYSFDSAQTYLVGDEYHVRNVGAGDLTLTAVGTFVLNAPSDGTLVIPTGGVATIKITGEAEADVFGVTVPA